MSKKIITFHYTLTNRSGDQIDTSRGQEPLAFLTDARQIIEGLERELLKMKTGDKRRIEVAAAEAYGERNDELMLKVPREELPGDSIKVGDEFKGGETDDAPVFKVIELTETEATLDANHSLAGVDLFFDVEIIAVREATAEETEHGHAHDGHSHGHHH